MDIDRLDLLLAICRANIAECKRRHLDRWLSSYRLQLLTLTKVRNAAQARLDKLS